MQIPFFPFPLFAWIYLAVLLALLAVASYTDLGRMIVPKAVTLTAMALGLAFNVVRGALLGGQGLTTWTLESGPWLGALDGLLFALAGFILGFALFFAMWMVGVCGGGDVKLFAALGAWVGPYLAVCVLSVTLVVVAAFVLARLVASLFRRDGLRAAQAAYRQGTARAGKPSSAPGRRVLGFSLPLAIATTLVLLWAFRVDLHFVSAPGAVPTGMASHGH